MVELIVLGAFALSLFVCVGLGVSILYALILGFVLFCGYGVYRGHGLREMLSLALSGVRTVKGILLTFLLIGVITALWRRSGTIAFITCRALDLCGERVMLPAAFLLCALISYLTGTAFGTAATMGVICAALAAGMGIPAVYIGGAVISGSYFGDRCSPMSTSALLVSSLTGTDIYRNLGGMVKTSLVPFFVSVALYALLGLGLHGSYDVSQMQALFSGTFKLTPSVLLPAADLRSIWKTRSSSSHRSSRGRSPGRCLSRPSARRREACCSAFTSTSFLCAVLRGRSSPGTGNGARRVPDNKKASQSLPPAGGKKFESHFLSLHVRERKYFSVCKCGICPPPAGKLCAQQTASLLSKKTQVFSTVSKK